MKSIIVKTSGTYEVRIGTDLLHQLGPFAAQLSKCCKAAIISDSNVWPLYGEIAKCSLEQSGYQVLHYVFPAGEKSKNGNTYLEILNYLAQNNVTRSDLIIALGGGVVGDMAGFVAATFLRGIPYIQVPTTLLAMVDSSVGGKTAIDLPAGKNLAGAFYQPVGVLCDLNALLTLPEKSFRDGCAEVIKYSILFDASLFSHLDTHGLAFDREMVISRCVELKRDVVMKDEFDTGLRQKLNLGHTLGHSVEACSCFSVSHGHAVAIGMAVVARAAGKFGICATETSNDICGILEKFNLPTSTEYAAQSLYQHMLTDKKRFGNSVNLIIPASIGNCQITPYPVSELRTFIEAGL